jgi:hypothetical protein
MQRWKMKTWLAIIVLVIAGLGYAYWQNLHEEAPIQAQTPLQQAGNACDLIASKAAAHLPETLPFQKLEKAARQSRVLGICMNDHGYIENPVWVKYVAPQIKTVMQQQSISENEAYETLKREAMLVFISKDKTPLYWRSKSS